MGSFSELTALAAAHGQYPVEAYAFVGEALRHAAQSLGKQEAEGDDRHITARQLAEGVLALAAQRYGLQAADVLRAWGLIKSEDIGTITYHLIECGIFGRQPSDDRRDFDNGPPFSVALEEAVRQDLTTGAAGS